MQAANHVSKAAVEYKGELLLMHTNEKNELPGLQTEPANQLEALCGLLQEMNLRVIPLDDQPYYCHYTGCRELPDIDFFAFAAAERTNIKGAQWARLTQLPSLPRQDRISEGALLGFMQRTAYEWHSELFTGL